MRKLKENSWSTSPWEIIDPQGSYECHQILEPVKKAIPELLDLMEKYPPGAERAVEALYNVARSAIAALHEAEELNPKALKSFASLKRSWPHMLTISKGWSKRDMPADVRYVLYEMGLGTYQSNLLKKKDDTIGRFVKRLFSQLSGMDDFPEYWHVRLFESKSEHEWTPEEGYLANFWKNKPALSKKGPVLRKWANAIFDLIFLDRSLWLLGNLRTSDEKSKYVDSETIEAEIDLVEMQSGRSKLYDKNSGAYSLLRPISDTQMENLAREYNPDLEICRDEARQNVKRRAAASSGENPKERPLEVCDEEIEKEAAKIFARRHGEIDFEHPTDSDFKDKAVEHIQGRLESMVPKDAIRKTSGESQENS